MGKGHDRRGWAFAVAVLIARPPMMLLTRRRWTGGDRIPSGGCVIVLNHISHLDPLLSAHFVYDNGRIPHYLAKSGLFRNRALGAFLLAAGQIPVERLSSNATGAFDAAVAAVHRGECVVVYPEGTLTRDPALWPMTGKTGAARIALATGCPVIPVGQWGAQALLPPYTARLSLLPRKTIAMLAGDPVLLDDLVGSEPTPAVVAEATTRIMAAITGLVEQVRGARAPAVRFDPRAAGIVEIGNPKRKPKKQSRPTQEEQ